MMEVQQQSGVAVLGLEKHAANEPVGFQTHRPIRFDLQRALEVGCGQRADFERNGRRITVEKLDRAEAIANRLRSAGWRATRRRRAE